MDEDPEQQPEEDPMTALERAAYEQVRYRQMEAAAEDWDFLRS